MPKSDELSHLFRLRSASVLVLLYLLTGFSLFAESNGFRDWSPDVLLSLLLMATFVVLYSWSYVALFHNDDLLLHRLLWIESVPLVLLHFTMQEMGTLLTFVVFWIARTPLSYNLRTCSYLVIGSVALYLTVSYFRDVAEPVEFIVVGMMTPVMCFFVLSISSTAVNLQRARLEALALNRELQAAQLQLAQSSRSSERLRIARDIHDLLGHQMTALVLNLEVARHKTAGDGLTHVERSLALAKMLLSDLRNAVSDMRENPALDFDSALEELLANVPGLTVTLERQPDLAIHDAHTAEVLLRCIQEALTNTLRHAHARNCRILLYREGGQLVLDIHDDGTGPARIAPGNGLKGMQERVAALAGSLQWHNDNGSFRVRAQLPFADAAV